MRAASRPALFTPLLAALIAAAWLVLFLWDASPYSRYLHHANWSDIRFAALCSAIPGGTALMPGLLHVTAWLLMITAMMLPTTVALLDVFRRLTAARTDRHRLLSLVLLGYLGIWVLFGLLVHALDGALHALASHLPWLMFHGWLIGTVILVLAGAYQFSALKYHCLDKCRSPLMFVTEHWHGRSERRDSFLLGVRHGAFCVGCCWALMLLMFAVGAGSVGWMLALGSVMAIEKNLRWGRQVGKPLGAGLLLWSGAIIAYHL